MICRIYMKSSTWHDISTILAPFLDPKKCCRNYVETGTKWPKYPKLSSRAKNGPTWENNNPPWLDSDAKIWITGVQEGDPLAHKRIFQFSILAKLLLAKNIPNYIGIQLPNAGDYNHSCHILTVLLIKTISYGSRSMISTAVLYSIQMYQFLQRSGGVPANSLLP